MKTRILIFKLSIILLLFASSCTLQDKPQPASGNTFTFAFLTDIHLQPERNAEAGFRQTIDSVNKLNPEFVITGGDLIMDALGQSYGRSDSLYTLYTTMAKEFKMPVYNTMGNHEIFGWYEKSGVERSHPQFGKRMYEDHLGARYRVFTHKGWRIFILDSVEPNDEGGYKGEINPVQMDWIRNRLAETPKDMPIIVSTHIPFITTEAQLFGGSLTPNAENEVVTNSKEVLELFKEHNLKLVLQGHLHFYEYMYAFGTTYITAGAVSGAWWRGDYHGTQEGFLLVHVDGEDFSWEYFDYGWNVD
jgi:3',5'-cyclic AMP phosphodiesterase CpdA